MGNNDVWSTREARDAKRQQALLAETAKPGDVSGQLDITVPFEEKNIVEDAFQSESEGMRQDILAAAQAGARPRKEREVLAGRYTSQNVPTAASGGGISAGGGEQQQDKLNTYLQSLSAPTTIGAGSGGISGQAPAAGKATPSGGGLSSPSAGKPGYRGIGDSISRGSRPGYRAIGDSISGGSRPGYRAIGTSLPPRNAAEGTGTEADMFDFLGLEV